MFKHVAPIRLQPSSAWHAPLTLTLTPSGRATGCNPPVRGTHLLRLDGLLCCTHLLRLHIIVHLISNIISQKALVVWWRNKCPTRTRSIYLTHTTHRQARCTVHPQVVGPTRTFPEVAVPCKHLGRPVGACAEERGAQHSAWQRTATHLKSSSFEFTLNALPCKKPEAGRRMRSYTRRTT